MPPLGRLIDPAPPIGPDATGAEVLARFMSEPATELIAVVDAEGRPVGALVRGAVLTRMLAEPHGPASARSLMDPSPLLVDADAQPLQPPIPPAGGVGTPQGFIAVGSGRYLGVGSVPALLQTACAAAERRADEASRAAERFARAETEARDAVETGARFLQRMSGEMGAALRGVLAVTELLEQQSMAGEAPAHVRTIADSSRTLLRLLSDAEELSRADRGELDFCTEPVRLRDVIDGVQLRWLPRAGDDGVVLGALYQGEAGLSADLDAGRLNQVFDCLIEHSLRFTRRGGVEAGLEAVQEGERVLLRGRVRDTGRSIDPARLASVFEPFERLAPYATGLGLAKARSLVQQMGGRIWAENNEGSGATIRFEFDAPACAGALDSGADAGAAFPLRGRILIVDDNATNRAVARTLVEMFGCSCETVEDGIAAVEAVSQGEFDAVLMDIRMPRLDGVAAARAIRALHGPAASIPIVALTANADPEDARLYRQAGMAGLVEKPIKAESLLLALTQALAGELAGPAKAAA